MSSGELLSIFPRQLSFAFELGKQLSCSLQLSNNTDNYVALKVKTTDPKKYCVRPNIAVVMPQSTCRVMVIMQPQTAPPPDLQCKDKFLIQSIVVNQGATTDDVQHEMFNENSGYKIEEYKFRVVLYDPDGKGLLPYHTISRDLEGARAVNSVLNKEKNDAIQQVSEFLQELKGLPVAREENSSCNGSGSLNDPGVNTISRDLNEARSLISELTKEKNDAIQQANKFCQELKLLKCEDLAKDDGGTFRTFTQGLRERITCLGQGMGYEELKAYKEKKWE